MNNKSMGRCANKIKGIPTDQRKFGNAARFDNAGILRFDDFCEGDRVIKRSRVSRELNMVMGLYALELAEKRIAVGGDGDVSFDAGQGRAGYVSGAKMERIFLDALKNHHRNPDPWNIQFPHDAAFSDVRGGCFCGNVLFDEPGGSTTLIHFRIRDGAAGIDKQDDSDPQE